MRKTFIMLIAAAALTACSAEPVGRSGAPIEPVTLNSVWGQDAAGVGGDLLVALIDQTVKGPVIVTGADRPAVDDDPSDDELSAVRAVQAGEADLTVARSGAVQQLGARSLAPLAAPLVVTNPEQAAAIAADPDINKTVTADLAKMGLTSLALVPGGLRHPFAYGNRPLLAAADYAGQTLNVRRDAGAEAILEALGATPDHSVNTERTTKSQNGQSRGIEVSVQQVQAVDMPAVQAPNVTLYDKFDLVLINTRTWKGLSSPQQRDLREKVSLAVKHATSARLTESQGQSAWCNQVGARSVLASAKDLATLRNALQPLTDAIAAEGANQSVIDQMRALHEGTADPVPRACEGPAPAEPRSAYVVKAAGDQGVWNGTWRLSLTQEELEARGVSTRDALMNAGVWQFTMTDGYADGVQPDGRPCNAEYAINGNEFSIDWGVRGVDDCGGLMRGTWRIDGDRLALMTKKEMEYDVLLDQAMFDGGLVRVE